MKNPFVWILILIIVVFGGWWLWTMQQNTQAGLQETPTTQNNNQVLQPTGTQTDQGGYVLNVNGNHLSANNGMTLYVYSKDTAGVSNCKDTCAANWPPYTVGAGTVLTSGPGVTGSIGTMVRADGSTQLTYKGMPLYFWIKDTTTADATGGGVNGFLLAIP